MNSTQQRWMENYIKGNAGSMNLLKREKTHQDLYDDEENLKTESDRKELYQIYAGKFRKSAVKSNPNLRVGPVNPVRKFQNSDEEDYPCDRVCEMSEMCDNSMGRKEGGYYARQVLDEISKCGSYHDNVIIHEIDTKRFLLEEYRKVYYRIKTSEQPSHRLDLVAWKEIKKIHSSDLAQIKRRIGKVPGVEIGDEFNLRVELKIMGIHNPLVHGIDYKKIYSNGTSVVIAASVVATEGYGDKMSDPNVIVYTGEGGGNFESGHTNKSKMKDQVPERGNLALGRSMKQKNDVRVIRGLNCGGGNNRTVFVYDGLYRVVHWREQAGAYGYKQFKFKLVRNPGQKNIVWAKYK